MKFMQNMFSINTFYIQNLANLLLSQQRGQVAYSNRLVMTNDPLANYEPFTKVLCKTF